MGAPSARPPTLRERTRDAVRAQVRTAALELFMVRGFDATTTEDIARSVGISPRSFFRYFATKEDVLVGGWVTFGDRVCAALAARPMDERIWASLRRSLDPVAESSATHQDLDIFRVVMSAASLRAHSYEKHLTWEMRMIPVITGRLENDAASALDEAETLAHVAMACLDVALSQWVRHNGNKELASLLDDSFSRIEALNPSSGRQPGSGLGLHALRRGSTVS